MGTHFIATSARTLLLACALVALAACSNFNWRRMAYESAEQYGCQQQNAGRMDRAARDASCSNPQDPDHVSYEQYEAARRAAGAGDK